LKKKISCWFIIQKVYCLFFIKTIAFKLQFLFSISVAAFLCSFSYFPHGTCFLSVIYYFLGLEGGSPAFLRNTTMFHIIFFGVLKTGKFVSQIFIIFHFSVFNTPAFFDFARHYFRVLFWFTFLVLKLFQFTNKFVIFFFNKRYFIFFVFFFYVFSL